MGGTKCNLENDRDVQMMLMSQSVANVDFTEIELVDTSNTDLAIQQKQSMDVMDLDDLISNFNPVLVGNANVDQLVSITDS